VSLAEAVLRDVLYVLLAIFSGCAVVLLVAAIEAAVSASLRWASGSKVPASTVTPGDYAEARLDGLLRAADHVKPSWEDPHHPCYEGPTPTPESERDAMLDQKIEHLSAIEQAYEKARNEGKLLLLPDGTKLEPNELEGKKYYLPFKWIDHPRRSSWS
jgi:hypothetical protein